MRVTEGFAFEVLRQIVFMISYGAPVGRNELMLDYTASPPKILRLVGSSV